MIWTREEEDSATYVGPGGRGHLDGAGSLTNGIPIITRVSVGLEYLVLCFPKERLR